MLKSLERRGKAGLAGMARALAPDPRPPIAAADVRSVLVLRMDQRIGNGLLLLPLLRAIRKSHPRAQLHLLLHRPVVELITRYEPALIDRAWVWDQPALLRNPAKLTGFLARLRRADIDVVLSSQNPDGVSLSHTLLGRWCGPRTLVGFRSGELEGLFDIAVESTTRRHYRDAQLDLWRPFAPDATVDTTPLAVPPRPDARAGRILLWLGATAGKGLPPEVVQYLLRELPAATGKELEIALGPHDEAMRDALPAELRDRVVVWRAPLAETAAYFAGFEGFVSADTGPLHLAVAIGVPSLSVFLQTVVAQYGYTDPPHVTVKYESPERDRPALESGLREWVRGLPAQSRVTVPQT